MCRRHHVTHRNHSLNTGGKVLLLRRPPTDPRFPNLWHMPGSLQLKRDTIGITIDRIIKEELNNVVCSDIDFLGYADVMHGTGFTENRRGQERPLLFTTWVKEEDYKGEGKFFPLSEIPGDIIPHHKYSFLPLVRKKFFPNQPKYSFSPSSKE